MGASTIILFYAAQQNARRRQEHARRMREEDERRKKQRREEEQRKEEEHRKMVEHRKNSPVYYTSEGWQLDRCLKAVSLQPSTKNLLSIVDEERPTVVKEEQDRYDQLIVNVGYKYEGIRQEIDSDIKKLEEMGIRIEGKQYCLTRISPQNTHLARPEQVKEYLGETFIIGDKQPIQLNEYILSEDNYYEKQYMNMNPEEIEAKYNETMSKLRRYQLFGKYLKFLLRTEKYLELDGYSYSISKSHEECEQRKKEMESFQLLSQEQLLVIKSYINHLKELSSVSNQLTKLFQEKDYLSNKENQTINDFTIRRIIDTEEYSDLLLELQSYISKIEANDEETMKEAYELVKGEYPINISSRNIISSLVSKVKKYTREEPKQLKLK